MSLSPKKISEQLRRDEINKFIAFEQLISFIENSENENIRREAIEILDIIGIYNTKLFEVLENILISDTNEKMRYKALRLLEKRFLVRTIKPLRWAINHEKDYKCLIAVIKSLENLNSEESKLILFNKVKQIIKTKYLHKEKRIENKKFRKIIKKLFKNKKYELFTQKELSEILINFLTIKNLVKQYPNVYFELNAQNGLVEELDLSDFLEYEVKGTPFGWKNNIKSLSEISGLNHLNCLKKINLSNNQIKNVKELINFEKLTHLTLVNNKISKVDNINFIKSLSNLEYLDIRGNELAMKVNKKEFDSKIKVLLRDSYIKIK